MDQLCYRMYEITLQPVQLSNEEYPRDYMILTINKLTIQLTLTTIPDLEYTVYMYSKAQTELHSMHSITAPVAHTVHCSDQHTFH